MRRAATVLVLAFLAFPGCSAQKQTQIIIGVSTDIPSTRFDEVFLGIGYIQPKQRVTEVTWRLGPEIQLPARFALVPGSDARRVVDITVEARKSGKTLVGRQARLSFVRDRVIFLSMNLIARCVGVKCGEDQTCGEIGCETVDKNGEKLPDYSPDLETSLADAGAADAFPADLAGGDATIDSDATVDSDGPRDARHDSDGGGDGSGDATADGQPVVDFSVDGGGSSTNVCALTSQSVSVAKAMGPHVVIGTATTGLSAGATYVIKTSSGSSSTVEVWQRPAGLPAFVQRGAGHAFPSPGPPVDWDAIVHADGTVRLFYSQQSNSVSYFTQSPNGTWSNQATFAAALAGATPPITFDVARVGSDRAYVALAGDDGVPNVVVNARYEASSGGGFAQLPVNLSSMPPGLSGPEHVRIGSDGTMVAITLRISGDGVWGFRVAPNGANTQLLDGAQSWTGPTAVGIAAGVAHFGGYETASASAMEGVQHQTWGASGAPSAVEEVVVSTNVPEQSLSITMAGALPRIAYLFDTGGSGYQLAVAQQQSGGAWVVASDGAKGSVPGRTDVYYDSVGKRLHAAYSTRTSSSAPYDVYYRCVPNQ